MVDAPVVVVFRTAVPDAEVAQGFMLQELGREYPGGSDLRCRVVLEDVIDLLPVVPVSYTHLKSRGRWTAESQGYTPTWYRWKR